MKGLPIQQSPDARQYSLATDVIMAEPHGRRRRQAFHQ